MTADVTADVTAAGIGTQRRTYDWEKAPDMASFSALDGLALAREMVGGGIPQPPVAATLGFAVVAAEHGSVRVSYEPQEHHYTTFGVVHGGVLSAVCDMACGAAAHTLMPAGSFAPSADLSLRFLMPVTTGTGPLTCEGAVLTRTARTVVTEARLRGQDDGIYVYATSTLTVRR